MRKLLILLPLLCSCSVVRSFLTGAYEAPKFTFKEVRFDKADLKGADVTLIWNVQNPNAAGLEVASADYALDVDGHRLVSGAPPLGLKIAGNGQSEVALPAHLIWTELAQTVEQLFSKDSVHYKASGTVGLQSTIAGIVSIPVEHEGDFPTPKLPTFSLDNLRIESVSLTGARLVVPIKLSNKNGFPLPLGNLAGDVQIGGERVGTLSAVASGLIAAGQERIIEVPLDISFLGARAAAQAIASSGNAEVKIDGKLGAGGLDVPIHVAQTVQLRKPQ